MSLLGQVWIHLHAWEPRVGGLLLQGHQCAETTAQHHNDDILCLTFGKRIKKNLLLMELEDRAHTPLLGITSTVLARVRGLWRCDSLGGSRAQLPQQRVSRMRRILFLSPRAFFQFYMYLMTAPGADLLWSFN